jgi:hypothetical protein
MPLTCPRPEPPDCGLYGQRVSLADSEAVRRLVLIERRGSPCLAALIEAEVLAESGAARVPVLPVARPVPVPLNPLLSPIKKGPPRA